MGDTLRALIHDTTSGEVTILRLCAPHLKLIDTETNPHAEES